MLEAGCVGAWGMERLANGGESGGFVDTLARGEGTWPVGAGWVSMGVDREVDETEG